MSDFDDELTQAERIRRLMHRCDKEAEHVAELKDQIETLRAERDEARREVCDWCGIFTKESPQVVATKNGWDCFKEETQ